NCGGDSKALRRPLLKLQTLEQFVYPGQALHTYTVRSLNAHLIMQIVRSKGYRRRHYLTTNIVHPDHWPPSELDDCDRSLNPYMLQIRHVIARHLRAPSFRQGRTDRHKAVGMRTQVKHLRTRKRPPRTLHCQAKFPS